MNRIRKTGMMLGVGALLLALLSACALESEAATRESDTSPVAAAPASMGVVGAAGLAAGAPLSQSAALFSGVSAGEAGIWVSGESKVAMEPDLAILSLGVEVTEMTVASANAGAATAMDAIMAALAANGVETRDTQTYNFNVRPRYEWVEVDVDGRRSNKQVLVGYTVSNHLTARIRDLDVVGGVIDGVVTAGGDATRFNGVRFTVEDMSAVIDDLREKAVMDAMARAQSIADTAGVVLGSLAYITELTSSGGNVDQLRAEFALAAAPQAAAVTSISGGELEVSMTVRAAFAIE